MPVSFCYMNAGTTERVPLNKIDELMCEMLGKPVDADEFCMEFQIMEWIGTTIVWHGGPSTKEMTEAYIKTWKENMAKDHPEVSTDDETKMIKIIRRFCYEEYVFDAWR